MIGKRDSLFLIECSADCCKPQIGLKHGFTGLAFELREVKANIKDLFSSDYIIAMVTYCVTNMITTFSLIIEQFFF